MNKHRIRNDAGTQEILIYDEIGFFGVRAVDILAQLKNFNADPISVRINSPGGDVVEAVAIYNALRNKGSQIIVHIDALAASSASMIAMAGDKVHIAENAFFMIHNPWAFTLGDSKEHRDTAALLDRFGTMIADTYRAKSGATAAKIQDWMDAETWFTGQEAIDEGFADELDATLDVAASFDLTRFDHTPDSLRAGSRRRIAASLARPRATSPTTTEDDMDLQARVTELEGQLTTVKAENVTIKAKLDAAEAAVAERTRLSMIETKLKAAALPDTLVTKLFREQLVAAKDEAGVDALITERTELAKSIGGSTAASTERVIPDPAKAGAPKAVTADVVTGAVSALFS